MQNEQPLISIVVPVYNVEKYLERCLNSIIQQTYSMLEIILVDDGSTDCSGEICDKYSEKDKRIRVIHKKNGGQSRARNVGIDNACGEYISFVDSDDWVAKDYIDSMYKLLIANNCDIAICETLKIKKEETEEKQVQEKNRIYFSDQAIKQLLYQRILTSAYGKLYKICLWDGIRFPEGKIYEEIEPLYLLFQKSEKIVTTNVYKYYYVYRNESTVNQNFTLKKMDYVDNCRNVLEHIIKDYPQYEKAAISRLMWAEIHVLVHMDNQKDYLNEYKLLIHDVKKYRWIVLKDKENKLKTRIVAGLSFMGYKVLKDIFKLSSM